MNKPLGAAPAKFLQGSTMRHIVQMTAATAVGLLAVFAVDFINIFYLNRLGQIEVSAAAGYSSTLFFFLISIGIGCAIAATAIVSPALGAGDVERARRFSGNIHVLSFGLTAGLGMLIWPFLGDVVALMGASGDAKAQTVSYLRIAVPSMPFLTAGMVSAAVLRSLGDGRRAMLVMLIGAIFTALLDPIFIFGCGLGIEGAAIASSIARIALLLTGLNGAMRVHNLIAFSGFRGMWSDTPTIMRVAVPAVITNLATPFANAYVTGAMAKFGDGAVSGSAIIGRLLPVAFVGTFALTGSVGPILGQNLGAGLFPRVRGAFTDALIFAAVYTLGAWLLLALTYPEINLLMKANGEAGEITAFFCRWLTPLFGFLGGLFVATAAFNNLGRPRLPSYINWGRATAGTVPFVMLGAHLGGAKGIMLGQALGSALFSVFAVYLCYRYVGRLETTPREQFYAAKSDEPQASEAAMS